MVGVGGAGLNGGFAAEWIIAVLPMNEGYAVFSNDAGHEVSEDNAKWAFGHPEKIADYGYRANHVGTVTTKAVIAEQRRDGYRLPSVCRSWRQTPDVSRLGGHCSLGG